MKQLITTLTIVSIIGLFGLSARAAGNPQVLTFELLAKTTYGENPPPVFPAELSTMEGQHVRISGFMVPFTDTENFENLVLVNSPGGCYFCSAPLPTAVVFVRRPIADPSLKYTEDLITFEGILHLWNAKMQDEDNAKSFFFTLDDAKVITPGASFAKGLMWLKDKANGK